MNKHSITPIRRQAADALRRARRLPVGHDRNDLRQVAIGLLWLEKRGYVAFPEGRKIVADAVCGDKTWRSEST